MNKEQKAAQVEEIAAQIKDSEAVFAVDYRVAAGHHRGSDDRAVVPVLGAHHVCLEHTVAIR